MPKDHFLNAKRADIGRKAIASGSFARPPRRRHKQRSSKPAICANCGCKKFDTSRQMFADGSLHTRADCKNCGKFVKWLG